MTNKMVSQIGYIFGKNFLIMKKNNELLKEVIFPVITAIFLILSSSY